MSTVEATKLGHRQKKRASRRKVEIGTQFQLPENLIIYTVTRRMLQQYQKYAPSRTVVPMEDQPKYCDHGGGMNSRAVLPSELHEALFYNIVRK